MRHQSDSQISDPEPEAKSHHQSNLTNPKIYLIGLFNYFCKENLKSDNYPHQSIIFSKSGKSLDDGNDDAIVDGNDGDDDDDDDGDDDDGWLGCQ